MATSISPDSIGRYCRSGSRLIRTLPLRVLCEPGWLWLVADGRAGFLFSLHAARKRSAGACAVCPRSHAVPYYAAMAAADSVLGCLLVDLTVRNGGERELKKHLSGRKAAYVKARVRRRAGFGLAFASLMPPPFPFTPFVIAAAAFQYPRRRLLTVIAGAGYLRFPTQRDITVYRRTVVSSTDLPHGQEELRYRIEPAVDLYDSVGTKIEGYAASFKPANVPATSQVGGHCGVGAGHRRSRSGARPKLLAPDEWPTPVPLRLLIFRSVRAAELCDGGTDGPRPGRQRRHLPQVRPGARRRRHRPQAPPELCSR